MTRTSYVHAADRSGPPSGDYTISAVLSTHNEEAVIAEAVLELAMHLGALAGNGRYEIVVVDDASHDGTAQTLEELHARRLGLPLVVVTHERNRGYGTALARGYDAAHNELIFVTSGARQFDVAELAAFLAEIDAGADLAIGWRRKPADPPLRRAGAWGWKLLVNGLFGHTARDVDCAFMLIRRRVWESLTVHARGAAFSAELLIKARRLGFRVKELPVSHFPRTAGGPTVARPIVIARALAELLRLRIRLGHELGSRLHSRSERAGSSHLTTDPRGGTGPALAHYRVPTIPSNYRMSRAA
jgi:glycosyltransferase involved in cell wall biosynthesis